MRVPWFSYWEILALENWGCIREKLIHNYTSNKDQTPQAWWDIKHSSKTDYSYYESWWLAYQITKASKGNGGSARGLWDLQVTRPYHSKFYNFTSFQRSA